MRLGEALQIIGHPVGAGEKIFHLLCGFTPLHLETFLKAHLKLRFSSSDINLRTGLFGDVEGNIQRARGEGGEGAVAIIEWSDLDQRLGFRASAGWRAQTLDDIAVQVEEKCRRIEAELIELAKETPVTVAAPSLGLPPLAYLPPSQISSFELGLNAMLAESLRRLGEHGGIRLASATALGIASPPGARHDIRMDLQTGFPYTPAHADALAELCVQCLFPAAPKKGVITDLDQTLWKGILGEVGAEGVSWSLEGKSQAHALYQQLLGSLADSGVLVAVASKNDPDLVKTALQRPDLLLEPSRIFPVEAGWGVKSDAVGRILEAWNIGADSVVFVDDSPMELAEVSEKYPGIECLCFPPGDPAGIVALLWQLRARFGRNEIREEDRLRVGSLRASAALRQESAAEASGDFLARLAATTTFEPADTDRRAFELVNKTNQFNLNGARFTEAEWKSLSCRPGAFLVTVSYEDRFGPLGRIAVIGGQIAGDVCQVDIWVMSCRAFSRQIEFQSIRHLFDKTGAAEIRFQFKPTARNGPVRTFFAHFFDAEPAMEEGLTLQAADFNRLCPPLFHQVNDKWITSETN